MTIVLAVADVLLPMSYMIVAVELGLGGRHPRTPHPQLPQLAQDFP
ncbi:MAG: hypothetical protein AAGD11_03640 [Planctomycetota bacterium]